ncbi:MBL fold metallo-hydrolase [Williamsia sterculiae]|uniref:Glyoxylase, beta-lactamase superfamily II n=1 Tax=Williamsia sterculiae TaxID=1344003 RepID=A0A1N7HGQ4_9NOCA|nr:MBL fold metallo-hydrolase [Williamsia sterculiae]SIS23858.1 Glyoxylase, beta-lactamase superfamily II [Williamsia sterculiae]
MTSLPISDDYTGDLGDGATAQRTTSGDHSIVKLSVGPMDNNTYLVTCRSTGDQLLIDAANDADRILALLDAVPGTLRLIFTTHQHPDHWQALAEVAEATDAPTAAGRFDAPDIPVPIDLLIDDGGTLTIGELEFTAVLLVGHTPGSIALALPGGADGRVDLFTGDSLFPGGLGKTNAPEDFDTLYRDVTTKLFDRFDDATVVFPGHGKDTTLGVERPQLDTWRDRGW